jgi:UDP-N-acetylmuramoyl-tripeptide--D-alanyl-D-alanine ligase
MRQACDSLHAAGEPAPVHWSEVDALATELATQVVVPGTQAPRSVLVKGSRFMRMERVVQALQALGASQTEHKDTPHAA